MKYDLLQESVEYDIVTYDGEPVTNATEDWKIKVVVKKPMSALETYNFIKSHPDVKKIFEDRMKKRRMLFSSLDPSSYTGGPYSIRKEKMDKTGKPDIANGNLYIKADDIPTVTYYHIKGGYFEDQKDPHMGWYAMDFGEWWAFWDENGKRFWHPRWDEPSSNVPDGYNNLIMPPHEKEIVERGLKMLEREKEHLTKYPNPPYYIRVGHIPKDERSRIFSNGREIGVEEGVSVFYADWDIHEQMWDVSDAVGMSGVASFDELWYSASKGVEERPIYIVKGDELDEPGNDGEPLLRNVKIIEKITPLDIFFPGAFNPNEDLEDYEREEIRKAYKI